jgi:prevent-host-death family protein
VSTIDVATLKANAEELVAKAVAGEPILIEQNGRRAVLLPCAGVAPDFELDQDTDPLLRERLQAPGREPTAADWAALKRDVGQ